VNQGFNSSGGGKLGPGVYVTPHVEYAELYSGSIPVTTKQGPKKYKCIFQLAVKPGGITKKGYPIQKFFPAKWHANYSNEDSEWLVPDPKHVRPYGILVKEVL